MTEYCAEYWKLSGALRAELAASGGRKTGAYHDALDELRAHLETCPECRAHFNEIPAEGKAAAEINPNL